MSTAVETAMKVDDVVIKDPWFLNSQRMSANAIEYAKYRGIVVKANLPHSRVD